MPPDPDRVPAGMVTCDPAGRVTYLNGRMLAWLEAEDAADYLGRPFYAMLAPAGRIYFETHLRPMLMIEGRVSEISLELAAASGARHRIYLSADVETDGDGAVRAIHAVCFEGTERHAYERELLLRRRKAEAYEAIVAASSDAIVNVDARLTILSWNAAAERLLGHTRREAIGKTLPTLIVPEDRRGELDALLRRVAAGEAVTVETVRRRKDGTEIPVEAGISRIRNERGEFIGSVGILRDITERKRSERIIETLNREVLHRSKNLLSVVGGMASMTFRHTGPDRFINVFSERLTSLANNLTLLVERNWGEVALDRLITQQLAHLGPEAMARVVLDGPAVSIAPDKAEALGMAMFELSTNAVKYGALSVPTGRILIHWRRMEDGSGNLSLTWRESGLSEVTPPSREGFGSLLTGRMLEISLSGKVEATYAPGGLSWHCAFSP